MARECRIYSDQQKAEIYGLYDSKGNLFYIGSTKYDAETRWLKHQEQLNCGNNKNLHFCRKVEKIGVEYVAVKTLEIVDIDEQFTKETEWISRSLEKGITLTNKVLPSKWFAITPTVINDNDTVRYLANYSPRASDDPLVAVFADLGVKFITDYLKQDPRPELMKTVMNSPRKQLILKQIERV